jgi:short-subunit dehydrogenase
MTSKEIRPWRRALVTGASAGIGEAIVRQLAAAGTNVVVVARDEARLELLAAELRQSFGVDVEVVAADLIDRWQRQVVVERLAVEPDIDLVVNNAGFGVTGGFVVAPATRLVDMVECNVTALTDLTRAAAGAMVKRGGGTILNVSSLVSLQPGPGFAVYAATKAYVTSLTESLAEELRPHGIVVVASLPGLTRTEFQQRSGSDGTTDAPMFAWMSAEAVAADALDAARRGRVLSVPGIGNRALALVSGALPRRTRRWASGRVASR